MPESSVFVYGVVFYLCFFTLLGMVSFTDVEAENPDDDGFISGILSFIADLSDDTFLEPIIDFFGNIGRNITGFPIIINVLIFTPITVFGSIYIINFIKGFIPFL